MNSDFASTALHEALEAVDPDLRPATERLLAQLDDEDLAERGPRDIVGAATSMCLLAGQRDPGETLISVFTPTLREHGWTSRRTIVNIITDDAPFLVDSAAAAIARQGLTVHLLMHPLVSVRRDDDGALLGTDAHGGVLESWIHLEVDRVPTEEGRVELLEHLQRVLSDVHAAVADWRAMRRACLDIVTDLRTMAPASVDPASVAPTAEFLSWLVDENFTFLGYREHALETDDNGEDVLRPLPHTGLGILRKSTGSVSRLRPEAQRTASYQSPPTSACSATGR